MSSSGRHASDTYTIQWDTDANFGGASSATSTSASFFLILIALLLASNIFFGVQYFALQQELREARNAQTAQQINEKTLAFTKLFIEKVLQSDPEVDFGNRLLLENSVRAIGDEQILSQWKRFTESQTEQEAQQEVKTLLGLLIEKLDS